MKIAAILEDDVTTGGGFNQSLNAILQMARLCKDKYKFVAYVLSTDNAQYLEKIGISALHLKTNFVDRLLSQAATHRLAREWQSRLKLTGRLEKQLVNEGVDLVYFVKPGLRCLSLQRLNYIATVWDLCHRDYPEFPEVREFNGIASRNEMDASALPGAMLVLCDSTNVAKKIATINNVDPGRILAMPFSPAPFLERGISVDKAAVLNKYSLSEGYYFYPAQFWAHKNHIRIIQAMALVARERGDVRNLVLCGGDKGNLSAVRSEVARLGLTDKVKFLGFVPPEDMQGLYEGAAALVMPTYFGPTNIPPLEAWKLGTPVIYSRHLEEQGKDAAILVNPDSASELAAALNEVLDPSVAAQLVEKGRARHAAIAAMRVEAEATLLDHLNTFSLRLATWEGGA